jgi:hypothetical protein
MAGNPAASAAPDAFKKSRRAFMFFPPGVRSPFYTFARSGCPDHNIRFLSPGCNEAPVTMEIEVMMWRL